MKIKKIINVATMSALSLMLLSSAFTVVKAANYRTDFSVSTYSYYGDDYDITDFQSKYGTDSVELSIYSASGALEYRVLGSNNSDGSDYEDCSNGYVYRMSGAGIQPMINWVNEWGYDYAGLMATSVNDNYTEQTGFFVAR